MSYDYRVSVNLLTHPKFKLLRRRLGADGALSLFALWAFCVPNKPHGRLDGMTTEDVEVAADWNGEPSLFVSTLLELRWLDQEGDTLLVHDWADHNPWAATSEDRSDKARFSKLAQYDKELYRELKAKGVTRISASEMAELTSKRRTSSDSPAASQRNASESLAPTPNHSLSDSESQPIPKPPPQPKGEKPVVVVDGNPISLESLTDLYTWHHGRPEIYQQADLIKIADNFTSSAVVEAVEKSVHHSDKNAAAWILKRLERSPGTYIFEKDPANAWMRTLRTSPEEAVLAEQRKKMVDEAYKEN